MAHFLQGCPGEKAARDGAGDKKKTGVLFRCALIKRRALVNRTVKHTRHDRWARDTGNDSAGGMYANWSRRQAMALKAQGKCKDPEGNAFK